MAAKFYACIRGRTHFLRKRCASPLSTLLYRLSNTGSRNLAIGAFAGVNLTTGSDNIHIGNDGASADSNTIRIGSSQTATFIAGINGAPSSSGVAVFVNSSGQLGTGPSPGDVIGVWRRGTDFAWIWTRTAGDEQLCLVDAVVAADMRQQLLGGARESRFASHVSKVAERGHCAVSQA